MLHLSDFTIILREKQDRKYVKIVGFPFHNSNRHKCRSIFVTRLKSTVKKIRTTFVCIDLYQSNGKHPDVYNTDD